MSWLFLAIAIVVEVTATLSLKIASSGRPRFYAVVVPGYVAAFVSFSLALDAGLGLGVGYGIWAAAGVAATAVASKLLFREPLTALMVSGVGLIATGVLMIELGVAR
jgi:small multidrug resistance pump